MLRDVLAYFPGTRHRGVGTVGGEVFLRLLLLGTDTALLIQTDHVEPHLLATGRDDIARLGDGLSACLYRFKGCQQDDLCLGILRLEQFTAVSHGGCEGYDLRDRALCATAAALRKGFLSTHGEYLGARLPEPCIVGACQNQDQLGRGLHTAVHCLLQTAYLIIDHIVVTQHTDVLPGVPAGFRGVCPGGAATGIAAATLGLQGFLEPFVPPLRLVTRITAYPGVRVT